MANFVFNVGKGRIKQLISSGATLKALLLKTADTDAAMKDVDTITALLATVADEADFTNYARPTLASVTQTVDDTGDKVDADFADIVFTSAGGATNNTTTDLIIYYDPGGGDSACIPLVCLDAVFTTNGQNVTLVVDSTGFWSAS
jgi:hypothetical protein